MADLKAFAEQLVNLTVKEVNELATILKDEYGIEPAAAAVAVAAPAAGAATAAAVTPYFSSIPFTNSDNSTTVKLSISSNILSVFSLILISS